MVAFVFSIALVSHTGHHQARATAHFPVRGVIVPGALPGVYVIIWPFWIAITFADEAPRPVAAATAKPRGRSQ